MKALALLATLVVAVLAIVPAASADSPYQFSNRPRLELAATINFVRWAHARLHETMTVNSIGCAKAGVGRAVCAVVATNRSYGTSVFQLTLQCATDTGRDCTIYADPWSRT
jgi:hypothetical protein